MPQNLIEKIVQNYVIHSDANVHSGDFVTVEPAHVMTHDNTGAVMPKFTSIGASRIFNPRQPVFTLDHNVQDRSEDNLAKYRKIEDFAARQGVDFYPAGRGIGHQIMCEEGYAFPGTLVVASDSHSNMYGGLGALGTPIVRTDAAALWATGRTWWQIPPVARVILTGTLPERCSGKDVILTLCGLYNQDEVLNHAVEFSGPGLDSLSIEERLTIANMTTEWGALAGVFPIDSVCLDWLGERTHLVNSRPLPQVPSCAGLSVHPRLNPERLAALRKNIPHADPDAAYAVEISLNLSEVKPVYTGPHNVKTLGNAQDGKGIKIDKAYLVSCVNSRVGDIARAADVLRGGKVADHVKFYIGAASREVLEESRQRGDWQVLLEAGAIELPPGCGPCIGLGTGLLEDGEVGISATNRNFRGRMGSKNASAYLASPATVARSAMKGYIDIEDEGIKLPARSCRRLAAAEREAAAVDISDGFPAELKGELVWCHADNLNTDGIYPGKYTYVDSITPEQQADVVMENYDADFSRRVKAGQILAGGANFGTGSSREQAATALKYRGIACVIAESFSETYKRNALNNGFLVLEIPGLVQDLRKQFGKDELTRMTGQDIQLDFVRSRARFGGKSYAFSPVGKTAQELVLAGNLENKVSAEIKAAAR